MPSTSTPIPRLPMPSHPREFVALHPFASSAAKRWPLARFQEVAGALGPVQWLRGPEEQLAESVFIEDLGELAAWLGKAKLYIGNDSGITHLAAAVGVPVVALFGPTDPAAWGPRGKNLKVIHRPLGEITPVEVLEAATRLLK
jgi:heptosyltransferase-3